MHPNTGISSTRIGMRYDGHVDHLNWSRAASALPKEQQQADKAAAQLAAGGGSFYWGSSCCLLGGSCGRCAGAAGLGEGSGGFLRAVADHAAS